MNIYTRVHEWCRKQKPVSMDLSGLIKLNISVKNFFKIFGLLFFSCGVFLIAIYSYNNILIIYNTEFTINIRWLLFSAYIIGIPLTIIGTTFRMRSVNTSVSSLRRQYMVIGLSLLTISIFCYILSILIGALNIEYPYAVHSFLLRIFITTHVGAWLSPLAWFIGFTGWFVLFMNHTVWLKSYGSYNLFKVSYYILAFGAVIILISGLSVILLPFLPSEARSLLYNPLLSYYTYVHPFGILGLTFGWATITSIHLNKSSVLLLSLYIAFLIIITALFSILV